MNFERKIKTLVYSRVCGQYTSKFSDVYKFNWIKKNSKCYALRPKSYFSEFRLQGWLKLRPRNSRLRSIKSIFGNKMAASMENDMALNDWWSIFDVRNLRAVEIWWTSNDDTTEWVTLPQKVCALIIKCFGLFSFFLSW